VVNASGREAWTTGDGFGPISIWAHDLSVPVRTAQFSYSPHERQSLFKYEYKNTRQAQAPCVTFVLGRARCI